MASPVPARLLRSLFAFIAVSALLLVPGPASGAQGANGELTFTPLTIWTEDMVYDRVSNLIYASVPEIAGAPYGDRIVKIDPVTESVVGEPLSVGSQPTELAVSSDGQYLYVALEGEAAIRRVHLPTFTAGLQFALGTDHPDSDRPLYAEDIEVVPGDASTIAVSLKDNFTSPRHEGVALFKDGVKLPKETPGHTGSNRITFDSMTRATQPVGPRLARLYGLCNESDDCGFRRMEIRPDGVTPDDDIYTGMIASPPVSGAGANIEFDSGRVYTTTGKAIDPRSQDATLLGTYPGNVGRPVEAVADLDRVYFAARLEFREYDLDEFTLVESTVIELAYDPVDMFEIGGGDLAIRTTGPRIYFVRFGDEPLPEPTAEPASVTADDLKTAARAARRALRAMPR